MLILPPLHVLIMDGIVAAVLVVVTVVHAVWEESAKEDLRLMILGVLIMLPLFLLLLLLTALPLMGKYVRVCMENSRGLACCCCGCCSC